MKTSSGEPLLHCEAPTYYSTSGDGTATFVPSGVVRTRSPLYIGTALFLFFVGTVAIAFPKTWSATSFYVSTSIGHSFAPYANYGPILDGRRENTIMQAAKPGSFKAKRLQAKKQAKSKRQGQQDLDKSGDPHFWGAVSGTLPQRHYWESQWELPGTPWALSGHSRAMERTGFHLRGGAGHILLDAGVDLPSPHSTPPRIVLLTHAHIDHSNALPMILRKQYDNANRDTATHIFLPLPVFTRVRDFCQITFGMHHDERRFGHPMEAQGLRRSEVAPGAELCSENFQEGAHRLWRPVVPGMKVPVSMSNSGRDVIEVNVVKCFHSVPTCGYVLAERRRRVRPDLIRDTKKETEENVKRAKRAGEQVNVNVSVPLLAFLLDTTVQVLEHDVAQSDLIYSCPVIMIECSYLEREMEDEARRRKHTVWTELVPFVRHSITEAMAKGTNPNTWVLIHFSLRYREPDILEFFENMKSLGERLPPQERPPNLVLWLDSGIVEMWFAGPPAAEALDV